MRPTETSHLHFDLSFLATEAPAVLRVGCRRIPLERHDKRSREVHRGLNPALCHVPDEYLTHFAADVEHPSDVAQLLRVTTPSRVEGAKLDTLLLTTFQLPAAARREVVARRVEECHPNVGVAHPKLTRHGARVTMADDAASIVHVHDYKTALDAGVSLVFHHLELMNLAGKAAATVHNVIEYSNGISDLAQHILQQALAHQNDPSKQNWVFETPYLDDQLKPTKTYWYNWSDTTKQWLRGPMQDSLKQAKNDPSLRSTSTRAGIYTVQDGTTDVSAPSGGSTLGAGKGAPAATGPTGDYWTLNDLTPGYGFSQDGPLSFADGTFSISFTNDWLRWLSGYVEFLGANGQPVKPASWSSKAPFASYDTDTEKYVQVFSATNTILGVPVGNTATEISFTWPTNAASVRIKAGGIGRTGGIEGQDGTYVGSWESPVCVPGAVMTGVFNLGIPAICAVAGALVANSALKALAQKIFSSVMDVATTVVNGAISSAIQGGNTTTLLLAFVDLIPRLLLDVTDLALFLDAELGDGAANEAIPIFGWIALAVSELTDVALLSQTIAEVASSPATFTLVASRAIDATWTLTPDPDHQDTWPLEATHYEVTVTYKDGTSRTATGKMTSSPQTGPIAVTFDASKDNRLPWGGQVRFGARFYSDTGWLAGSAETDFLSAAISGNTLTVPQMAITEREVPLTSSTVYRFDDKLVFDATAGERRWTSAGGAPTATVKDLSGSNVGHNLAQLAAITVSQRTSEIGYTWEASGQDLPIAGHGGKSSAQMFTFQGLAVGPDPQSGYRFVSEGFTAKPLLLFDRLGPADGTGFNCWIDPRDDLFHVRPVVLDGSKKPFDLATGKSWGRFNQQIDAAIVHHSGYVVGVNGANSKFEILRLGEAPVADAQAPFANLHSGYGTRPGLIHLPVGVAATPKAGFVVLEAADSALTGAEARLQAFDLRGNPAPIFAGHSPVAKLVQETAPVTLLDVAIETKGFIYVLKFLDDGSQVSDYRLDLYQPDGSWLSQTTGIAAGRMAVDVWRTLYTQSFEILKKPASGYTEPSVSRWLPSTPTRNGSR